MCSRYSAFVVSDANYIIKTTHKENSDYTQDITKWKKSILDFSNNSKFHDLEIIEFIDGETIAYVTFTAIISSAKENLTFTEKSTFLKENNLWYYKSGVFLENM